MGSLKGSENTTNREVQGTNAHPIFDFLERKMLWLPDQSIEKMGTTGLEPVTSRM